MSKHLSKKQLKKKIDKQCHICGVDDYSLLDVHRITPGGEGGKYVEWNMVTLCCLCHRKHHSGLIKILGKYSSTNGPVIHFIDENGNENYK